MMKYKIVYDSAWDWPWSVYSVCDNWHMRRFTSEWEAIRWAINEKNISICDLDTSAAY